MSITEATTTAVDNGVNVEALLGAREALTAAPPAAQFTFSATNEWVNGTHSRTTVEKFFGLGEEQSHRRPYTVDTDHPEIFAAEDNGPTPPEIVLIGLAGCLTAETVAISGRAPFGRPVRIGGSIWSIDRQQVLTSVVTSNG